MRRMLACLVLALLAPMAAAAGGLPVATKAIAFKSKDFDIKVQYPQTGNAAIDAALAAYARKSVATFKTYKPEDDGNDRAYALDTTFKVQRNDGQMFAVLFNIYTDMGGAHPNTDYEAFDFLLPDGAQVFLPEILDGDRGLKRLSALTSAELMRTIGTGPDSLTDKDTIAMGTGPLAYNFKNFVWLPGRLHLFFPPYQVAAYAAGPQEAFIPLARIKDVIRPDWHAPAASFDCAKARSTVEHAICADAALARLDRQVAEAWQVAMRNAYEPVEQAKVRQKQRDWLARRDAACRGPAPGECLKPLYRARLDALSATP
jgi:uncharacterized protein YecT (DUF1311 family)